MNAKSKTPETTNQTDCDNAPEGAENGKSKILLVGVGGSPAPIIFSLNHHQPAYILYFASSQTRRNVRAEIEPALRFSPVDSEIITASDPQNFLVCVRALMTRVPELLHLWGIQEQELVGDITGGTKVMSAAMGLVLATMKSRFSYVGGEQRTKDGIGIVENGSEVLLHSENPWDALAVKDFEEIAVLFNSFLFKPMADYCEATAKRVEALRPLFKTLAVVAQGYEQWDGFEHKAAQNFLHQALKNLKLLRVGMPTNETLGIFYRQLEENVEFLGSVVMDAKALNAQEPKTGAKETTPASTGEHYLRDLLGNAQRRALSGRYDDATARLYSAIEKVAKIRLSNAHGVNSSNVNPDALPEPIRQTLEAYRSEKDGKIKIGLQKCFELLQALGDPLGALYLQRQKELDAVLNKRNMSLLAHGYQPVSKDTYDKLLDICLTFLGMEKSNLPHFPTMNWGNSFCQ